MSDIAIRVDGLSKRYRIGRRESYKTLRDSLTDLMYAPFRRFSLSVPPVSGSNEQPQADGGYIWALKDVSLGVKQGEVLGIIGRNGAGKSTLLKVLSRITEPTEGCIEIRGRVGSLLEVGTGFHPELTGRENIYLNGAILGMKRTEIDRKFDEIVAFAEIEKFIDTPVKRYSSGMYVRLAFAVAAHLDPEILVVDEVLAVGDAAFQEKCLGRMSAVSSEGRTVLFVSHNMDAILKLCNRVIWLDNGLAVLDDTPEDVARHYLKEIKKRQVSTLDGLSLDGHPGRRKPLDGVIRLTHCKVLSRGEDRSRGIATGSECRIVLGYKSTVPLTGGRTDFIIIFKDAASNRVSACSSLVSSHELDALEAVGEVECRIQRLPLSPGRYFLDIGCQVASQWSDFLYEAVSLDVVRGPFYSSGRLPMSELGQFLLDYAWFKHQVKTS